MKVSDVIKELQESIKHFGDEYVRKWEIDTENHRDRSRMLNPEDTDKLMTQKQFKEWCDRQRNKK